MDPSQNSSEKSVMFHPQAPPPVYQDNPAAQPPSYPMQSVPQGPYAQGPYPGQSVVSVQPSVFVTSVPLTSPVPDYLGYSIFTLLCCCLPLGIAALVHSLSARSANYSGQRELAEKNSKTARILNHVTVGFGLVIITLYITLQVIIAKKAHHIQYELLNMQKYQ